MKPSLRGALRGGTTVLALSGLLGFLVAASWDAGFEADPDGATDLVSDLDTFIQAFKLETRRRASVETIWGTGSDDNGLHRLGSARGFIQNAAPTDLVGPGQYNAPAGAFGGTPLADEELGASAIDQGTGRFWVDADGLDTAVTSDDRQLSVWTDTVGFQAVTALPSTLGLGGLNQVYNGSFEITDGTGLLASTTVASGWALLGTPDIAYDDVANSTEGDGFAMETIATGAVNEGATQTLAGLKESTVYVIRARVRPVVGTCSLVTTGGSVNATDTSAAASGVFETLESTFTTDATPANVVVRLESDAAADECDWDHVTVFERMPAVSQPGPVICRDTDSDVTNDAYTAVAWTDGLVSCSITPPAPGYSVQVRAQLVGNYDGAGNGALAGRLRENCGAAATVAMGTVVVLTDADAVGSIADQGVVPLFFSRTMLTPGTTCTYTIEGRSHINGPIDRNVGDDGVDDLDDSANLLTTLEVVMTPPH